jgi:membrane protein DedA with SNARE-associated domain
MNFKLVFASGIISSLIGAMIGYGVGQIALTRNISQVRSIHSTYYQNLYGRNFVWIGAGAFFAIGMGQECLRQLQQQQEQNHER